jgi:hypothetical protein
MTTITNDEEPSNDNEDGSNNSDNESLDSNNINCKILFLEEASPMSSKENRDGSSSHEGELKDSKNIKDLNIGSNKRRSKAMK